MGKGIFTIFREAEAAIEIKRSKFVGRSFKAATPEDALALVKRIKEAHRDSSHNCWAYRLGMSGEQARYNDDGEPRGTAGPPILAVLKKNNLTNTLVVVTRYYGGIKLGAGGLVRAYSRAAKNVLGESRLKELRLMKEIEAPVPYGLLTSFENYLSRENFETVAKDFREHVVVRLRVPAENEADFRSFYGNLVNGKLSYAILGEKYA